MKTRIRVVFLSSSSFIDEFFEIEKEIIGRKDEINLNENQINLLAEKYSEKGAAVFREFWSAVKKNPNGCKNKKFVFCSTKKFLKTC